MRVSNQIADLDDGSLYKLFGIPPVLQDLMSFAGVKFRSTKPYSYVEAVKNTKGWIMILPCKIPGEQVEIPLPDEIDKEDPEGHWRAILGAAADFQALVNNGDYRPGELAKAGK